jgi:hypothetical protein
LSECLVESSLGSCRVQTQYLRRLLNVYEVIAQNQPEQLSIGIVIQATVNNLPETAHRRLLHCGHLRRVAFFRWLRRRSPSDVRKSLL